MHNKILNDAECIDHLAGYLLNFQMIYNIYTLRAKQQCYSDYIVILNNNLQFLELLYFLIIHCAIKSLILNN